MSWIQTHVQTSVLEKWMISIILQQTTNCNDEFFPQVETCRETLMTFSLTDAENANTDTAMTTDPSADTVQNNTSETIDNQPRGNTEGEKDRGSLTVKVDCDGHSSASTPEDPEEQAHGDFSAMSTDDSDQDFLHTLLPQAASRVDK